MTFATEKIVSGREQFTVVEFDLDFCSLTFGVPPCPAVLSGPGLQCYNTFFTCPVKPSFVKTLKTYRFCKDQPGRPHGQNFFPALIGASITSARIDPGKGLGARASCSVTLQDFSDTDQFTDPYIASRTYIPINTGTFFGKLLKRNPNYYGRTMRVLTGYLVNGIYDVSNFRTRAYVIDKIVGPDKTGKVTITGRDPLVFAQESVAPPANKGKLTLALNAVETGGFTLDEGGADFPAANGIVRIGTELIRYTTRVGNVFTTLTRGVSGSTAAPHSVNSAVQRCLEYVNTNAVDIAYDLLTTFAGVPGSFIDLVTQWHVERDTWLPSYSLSTIITKPTKVTELIAELCEQAVFDIFYEEVSQKIILRAFAPPKGNIQLIQIDDNAVIENSVAYEEMTDKRITRVQFNFSPIDYTDELTEERNFEQIAVILDAEAESVNGFDDVRTYKIFSRWVGATQSSLAITTASRILNRYRNTPQRITYMLDIKDSDVVVGAYPLMRSIRLAGPSGEVVALSTQVIEVQERDAHTLAITALNSGFNSNYAFIAPNGLNTFQNESAENRLQYGFISNDNTPSTIPPNADAAYLIV